VILPAGNCWMGTDGTATPSDQSATSGWVNSAAGALHSPWNSSLPTAFSAAACSSFSICIENMCIRVGTSTNVTFTCSNLKSLHRSQGRPSYLLRISVEVQIGHDLPCVLPGDSSPHPENLPGQHPPHQTNRVVTLQQSHRRIFNQKICIILCVYKIHRGMAVY